jgi:hypothetical protein
MAQEGQPGSVISPGASQAESSWKFDNEDAPAPNPSSASKTDKYDVDWTASEFISHDKSAGWYLLLILGGLVGAAVVYLLTRDEVSTAVVVIVAILFGVSAARKPRELNYKIDSQGLHIDQKYYPLSDFRSFAIVREEAVESIWLMPLKRFRPPLSIYFDPNDGQKIVDVLAQTLPIENRELDPVDRLMHRIRF